MFHLIFWFAQGIFFILINFLFLILIFFIISSFFFIFNLLNLHYTFYILHFIIPYIFLTQPYWVSINFSLILITLIYFLDPTSYNHPNINLWNLVVESLKIIVEVRSNLHIPDHIYFFLQNLNSIVVLVSSFFFALIFCSSHQIFIIILITTCSLSTLLVGLSISFFSSLISLPFSPSSSPPFNSFSQTSLSPSYQFAYFLKENINSHPLEATVDESFYEDNLQIGDFFLAYPIFFNASPPNLLNYSIDDEIITLWHTIRWESAFSNQTGSASSRWSSLSGINFSSMPPSTHSVHTPIIPVFNEEIFSALNEANIPTFDPFVQPPEWSPYQIVISFLGWSEEEINEERLIEIEEED